VLALLHALAKSEIVEREGALRETLRGGRATLLREKMSLLKKRSREGVKRPASGKSGLCEQEEGTAKKKEKKLREIIGAPWGHK